MLMGVQDIIRWLLPREDKFFTLLEQHAAVVAETAAAMKDLPLGNDLAHEALEKIHELEHQGDALVRAVTLQLEASFVTPIDREDIHSLSTQLDDVLDYLYAAAQAFVTYDIHEKTPAMTDMLRLIGEATAVLKDALPLLRLHRLEEVAPARTRVITLEKQHDTVYRNAMGTLYRDPAIDAKELLRQQAVLSALEAAMDCCQDAADVLENIAIKHA
jgi:uncharacterized protein